jgi:hypothetical protein
MGLYQLKTNKKSIGTTRGVSCGNIAKDTGWYHK